MMLVAKLKQAAPYAIAMVLLFLLMGAQSGAWAREAPPGVSRAAERAHKSAKKPKAHPRRRSHSRSARSRHHGRSRSHSIHARTTRPEAKIQRIHAVRQRRHHVAAKPVAATPIAIAPQLQVAPPRPDWPANDQPATASVNWNGRELSINAKNSSLTQILADVSTATGVKVEGASGDQRIYGTYGPAPARDVLNELLEGSDYNMLMLGDSGGGTPRELVLSRKVEPASAKGSPDLTRANPDEDGDEDTEQPAEPMRRPFGVNPPQVPPGQPLTPQEQQMRLRRMQQQQQQPTPAESPEPQEGSEEE